MIQANIRSTLPANMLAGGRVWGLVRGPFLRLVGILVAGLVGVLVGPEVICVLVVGLAGVLSRNLD